MNRSITDGIENLVDQLKKDQSFDGSWSYPFETGISTDCYMIILLRTLEIDDENLIKELVRRIISKQEKNGAWKLFYDEGDGNVTATIEAYYALLYSGYFEKTGNRLTAARRFILKNGGIEKAHMFTKIMLAITGQHKWPNFFPIPLEFLLLPNTFSINFYQLSVFGRANLLPILILSDSKFQIRKKNSPDLSELHLRQNEEELFQEEDWRSLYDTIKSGLESLLEIPSQLKERAKSKGKQYMLSRIEKDGTFYSYYSSTFLMIFALMALGYNKSHPVITMAVNGLKSMKTTIDGFTHMQYTTATVWNTSLISYALQEAGVSGEEAVIEKANHFILRKQHTLYGDWAVHNPNSYPGGWGFSNINSFNPDVDDTTASLRSISRDAVHNPSYRSAWDRGMRWLLSMQNDDGGWPAFEKNTNSSLFKLLPIEKADFILTDPPTADLTGRTLQFLGDYTNLTSTHPIVKAGIESILTKQEKDGSWYGRWGICYLYGTWGAVTGLTAVGVQSEHPAVRKAVSWMESVQNEDGGWGESCKSDSQKEYVALPASTLTHTAWAVDALISVSDKPSRAIKKGIEFLLENLEKKDWTTEYPKGQGMAGAFYIHYHSYRYVFPLLALAHYRRKYEKS